MKKLIVTADDYGVFPNINAGVIAAVKARKVNSVATLSNHTDSAANVKRLLDDPEVPDDVEIGCHLTITSGRPLTGDKMDFACINGYFRLYNEFRNFTGREQLDALEKELEAQIETLNGIKSTDGTKKVEVKHLTNHHNSLTLFKHHFNVYMNVARRFGIPMRSTNIQPSADQRQYNLLLRLRLMDDMRFHERREMKQFSDEITEYFRTNANGVKAPAILDSHHYGPLPPRDIWPMALDNLTQKKHRDLQDLFAAFREWPEDSMELMVHLAEGDVGNINTYPEIDYPGVDTKYFDSRVVELNSLLNFPFNTLEGIAQKGWRDL